VPQTVVGDGAGGMNFANTKATKTQGIIAATNEEFLAARDPSTAGTLR
jgi:hypothetical protein